MTSLEQLDVDIGNSSDARTGSSLANSRSISELHTVAAEVNSENSSAPSPVHSSASTTEVASSSKNVSPGSTDQLRTVPSEVNFRVHANSVQQVSKKESTIRVVEVIGLVAIVLVLLALYMIPTIIYVRPPLQLEQVSEGPYAC